MFNEFINRIANNSPAAVMAIGTLKNFLSAEKTADPRADSPEKPHIDGEIDEKHDNSN